jgi:hypothetical protein
MDLHSGNKKLKKLKEEKTYRWYFKKTLDLWVIQTLFVEQTSVRAYISHSFFFFIPTSLIIWAISFAGVTQFISGGIWA